MKTYAVIPIADLSLFVRQPGILQLRGEREFITTTTDGTQVIISWVKDVVPSVVLNYERSVGVIRKYTKDEILTEFRADPKWIPLKLRTADKDAVVVGRTFRKLAVKITAAVAGAAALGYLAYHFY